MQASTLGPMHPLIKQILVQRGWPEHQLHLFFEEDLHRLPPLDQLKDMPQAVERLVVALLKRERIGIYGDYDVDGTTSCALLYHFFKMLNHPTDQLLTFQPSRFVEGYGLHVSSIDGAVEREVDVLITVDCGITSHQAAEHARQKGVDLIITDHHRDGGGDLPPALAVLNPNRQDEGPDHPLKSLAGVGVAFALAVTLRQELISQGMKLPSLYPLLPYVAIGTLCDLAPLTTPNLILVRHGLKAIKKTEDAGLQMFFPKKERQYGVIDSDKISFNVGPMINSKGRLDHPEVALKLLLAEENQEAFQYYNQLEICNRERKLIQKQVFDEVKEQIKDSLMDDSPVAHVVYAPHWHEGVIGIVASKVVETFKVPAIIFTDADQEGVIKASARSAGALNLHQVLSEFKDYFIKFGGHKAAAGLSMHKEQYPLFKEAFLEKLTAFPPIERTREELIDVTLKAREISPQLVRQLERLGPFGMGNPKPYFKITDLKLDRYQYLKETHVRWTFSPFGGSSSPALPLSGISFYYTQKWEMLDPKEILARQEEEPLSVFGEIGINRFNGSESIQILVRDLKF